MTNEIPQELNSSVEMLSKFLSLGTVGDEEYYGLISILYDEMSDRNLALVLSYALNKDCHQVSNDIGGINTRVVSDEVKGRVLSNLKQCGYEDWLKED